MKKEKISIREIAQLSSVSIATVSRVINNNGRFSEETRKKVMAVIDKYDYQTNSMAKALRMQKSNTVGIIVPDLSNSFFSSLVEKIERILFKKGLSTIICDSGRDIEKEISYLKMLEAKQTDGLIVISGQKEFDSSILTRNIPIICIDRKPNNDNVIFVSSNHYKGALLAANTLIKSGTNPFLFKYNHNSSSVNERIRGFDDALVQNNILFPNDYHITIERNHKDDISTLRKKISIALIKIMKKADGPLGIFSTSDALAADIIYSARELNINVPTDLKIIGFDNAPISRYCYPELTTINQNLNKIAEKSCSFLMSAIKNEPINLNNNEYIVDVSLIKRKTI